jgi:hypothetical protein
LAQLPDVSAELQRQRAASKPTGSIGYRFDPPQANASEKLSDSAAPSSAFPTLKSELVYAPRASRSQKPHVFDRTRVASRPPYTLRRESPVLPKSNPFAIPRRGLVDSIAPVVRFLTLVALFTAVGTWVQIMKLRGQESKNVAEPPATTAQQPAAPISKTAERAATAPRSSGPTGTKAEPNTRVGRARVNEDFAKLRGDILPVRIAPETISPGIPDLVGANGSTLPRVRMTEPSGTDTQAGANGDVEAPELARIPGFTTKMPSR